jgi:hypothetical protein
MLDKDGAGLEWWLGALLCEKGSVLIEGNDIAKSCGEGAAEFVRDGNAAT